ncbi:hypothetical protein HMPREF9103_01308 [Lentilactobacillus parafarraginis F0439]|uniref:Uncharacterized protein n=1 Tax=Lentilactobacillus parafarraginis F0439 TaxID=797515 RepID=G9ZNK5_9LACO|nr:hypothetical protein HMPREF9103_01308 [Lentilactobacillus parafarraginis F0439]
MSNQSSKLGKLYIIIVFALLYIPIIYLIVYSFSSGRQWLTSTGLA